MLARAYRSTSSAIPALLGRRFRSLATQQSRIAKYYEESGDSVGESVDLAEQAVRWLKEGSVAREKENTSNSGWESILEKMVDDLIIKHKPIAYILGTQPFYPLSIPLLIRPPTLIPRPETEHWVTELAEVLHTYLASQPTRPSASPPRPFRILDIGTGSGCIPLALAASLRQYDNVHAVGVDVADSAVELARENVVRCGFEKLVTIGKADLFANDFASVANGLASDGEFDVGAGSGSGGGAYDIIISNPPYITREAYKSLASSVKDWEDRGALVGEVQNDASEADDGLIFYRRIVSLLPSLLARPVSTSTAAVSVGFPSVVFEVGEGQAEAVKRLLVEAGFRGEIMLDQFSIERVVVGTAVAT